MLGLLIKVVAFSLSKKAAVYLLGRAYGYPRLYKRIITISNRLIQNPQRRVSIRNGVKYIFRLPNRLLPILRGRDHIKPLPKKPS
ncbi:hypothetical protein TrispH2_010010 [Trichoplax sp. H2]|nr:hypothetical protein TrispH2_010010 [Trichoplax sp. H2]|eukprot:RDD37448.1 hypothetical protein TrispH2_010010 [Trichoplax sp. H2]